MLEKKKYRVNYFHLFHNIDMVNVTYLFNHFCEENEFYLLELLSDESNIISGIIDEEEWDRFYNDESFWDGFYPYGAYAMNERDAKYIASITQGPLILYDKEHELYLFIEDFYGIHYSDLYAECLLYEDEAKRFYATPIEGSDNQAVNA